MGSDAILRFWKNWKSWKQNWKSWKKLKRSDPQLTKSRLKAYYSDLRMPAPDALFDNLQLPQLPCSGWRHFYNDVTDARSVSAYDNCPDVFLLQCTFKFTCTGCSVMLTRTRQRSRFQIRLARMFGTEENRKMDLELIWPRFWQFRTFSRKWYDFPGLQKKNWLKN